VVETRVKVRALSITLVPAQFEILTVCTANVCRSALAAQTLNEWVHAQGLTDSIRINSAGIDALLESGMCSEAAVIAHVDPATHVPQQLTKEHLEQADLILVADRTHRTYAARLLPSVRSRLFTMRQGADLGRELASLLHSGAIPEGAPALPETPVQRLRWLVNELDASRSLLAGNPEEQVDIPDDHGTQGHEPTLRAVLSATSDCANAMSACLKTRP